MTDEIQDELMIEMAYRWADIETGIEGWVYNLGKENEQAIGKAVAPALAEAFRVEARPTKSGTITSMRCTTGTARDSLRR